LLRPQKCDKKPFQIFAFPVKPFASFCTLIVHEFAISLAFFVQAGAAQRKLAQRAIFLGSDLARAVMINLARVAGTIATLLHTSVSAAGLKSGGFERILKLLASDHSAASVRLRAQLRKHFRAVATRYDKPARKLPCRRLQRIAAK
jgi:hypothetical protein